MIKTWYHSKPLHPTGESKGNVSADTPSYVLLKKVRCFCFTSDKHDQNHEYEYGELCTLAIANLV